jgi:hypothetical protein
MNREQGRVVAFFGVLVILLWGSCLGFTLWAMKPSESRKLESYGQLGDVFGSVNALFTGLALVGLVYTVFLQHKQTDALEQQLLHQKEESSRQARELFLTVRLNTLVASIQVQSAQHSALCSDPNMPRGKLAEASMEPLNRAGAALEIMALEASQGFDGGAWTPSVEKEAIRQYIVNLCQEFVASCEKHKANRDAHMTSLQTQTARQQFTLLADMYRARYPEIFAQCTSILTVFANDSDPTPAINWCRGAETIFQRGQLPWI